MGERSSANPGGERVPSREETAPSVGALDSVGDLRAGVAGESPAQAVSIAGSGERTARLNDPLFPAHAPLLRELRALRREVRALRRETRESLPPPVLHPYLEAVLRGVLQGFGAVVGATVVVSLFLYLLSKIDFIPILGDWIRLIIASMETPGK